MTIIGLIINKTNKKTNIHEGNLKGNQKRKQIRQL